MSERTVVDYARPSPSPRRRAGAMSAALVLVQCLWFWPTSFGLWVLQCNSGLIHSTAANVAGAAFVVAPSIAAVALGANVVRRGHGAQGQRGFALIGIVGGLLWITYVSAAVTRELLDPSPYPCL